MSRSRSFRHVAEANPRLRSRSFGPLFRPMGPCHPAKAGPTRPPPDRSAPSRNAPAQGHVDHRAIPCPPPCRQRAWSIDGKAFLAAQARLLRHGQKSQPEQHEVAQGPARGNRQPRRAAQRPGELQPTMIPPTVSTIRTTSPHTANRVAALADVGCPFGRDAERSAERLDQACQDRRETCGRRDKSISPTKATAPGRAAGTSGSREIPE